MTALYIYLGIGAFIGAFDLGFAAAHGDKGPHLWAAPIAAGLLWPGALIYWTIITRNRGRGR